MFPTTTILVLSLAAGADPAWEWRTLAGEPPLEYALVRPPGHDPERPAPLLLALPPGDGSRALVEEGLGLYFADEARRRGWVVACPAAPAGGSLAGDAAVERLAALVDALAGELAVEGGRAHLAGVSNGGRAAFRLAGLHPERLLSLTGLPGAPEDPADGELLAAAAGLPVTLFVGELDAPWREASEEAAAALLARGARDVELVLRTGEEHVLHPSVAPLVFDRLEEVRAREAERAAVAAVLDELHAAAAAADAERYFAQFAPDAVFLGTDAGERWSLPAFRAYAGEPFASGRGWTYVPRERHVELAPGGTVAWFDELLWNERYGTTRGSGVLVRAAGRWRIAHYVLSFTIPNDAAPAVVRAVRESEAGER